MTNNGGNPKKNSFKKELEMMNTQEKILIENGKTKSKFKNDETKNFGIDKNVYNLNNNICINKIIRCLSENELEIDNRESLLSKKYILIYYSTCFRR